jgi:hypothetical protein
MATADEPRAHRRTNIVRPVTVTFEAVDAVDAVGPEIRKRVSGQGVD